MMLRQQNLNLQIVHHREDTKKRGRSDGIVG
jgi:hypothetical protein